MSGHLRLPHSSPTRRSSDLSFHTSARHRQLTDPHTRRVGNGVCQGRGHGSLRGFPGSEKRLSRPVDHVYLEDRKSTRLNSSHSQISYAVFCLKKKKIVQVYT